MIFGSNGIIKEVKEQGESITKQLIDVKERIPYQSELEKQYNKLQDENIKLKKEVKQLSDSLTSLQETNEKLVDYIQNIEEIKQNNGFKIEEYSDIVHEYKVEIITIPALKIAKKVVD